MKITVNVNGKNKLNFNVSVVDYERFLNEITEKNKIAPSKTFIRQTVENESHSRLEELIKQGLAVNIASKVFESFTPNVEITVEKSEDEPSE